METRETLEDLFILIPNEITLLIAASLDLKSQIMLSMASHYWKNLIQDEQLLHKKNYVRNIYGIFKTPQSNERKFDQQRLMELVAATLNTTPQIINASEQFEQMVLDHILELAPDTSQGKLTQISVSDRASFFYSPINDKICIGYRELTVDQVRDMATAYNRFYLGINARYYPGQFGRDSYEQVIVDDKKPGAVLGLDTQVFCKKVLPVIKGIFHKPSLQEGIQEEEKGKFEKVVYRC